MPTNVRDRPGGLSGQSPDNQKLVFPLKHTEVLAKIAGNISRVEVTQTFENPFTDPLDAVYVFPLPDEAAVDDMEIKIGDRLIKGYIKKRSEAKQIYEQAKRQGRTAGLLEQERDNIFTQSLANIKPGEQIDVTIRYTESLKFEGGDYEFVFPMVVFPRFIPGTPLPPVHGGAGGGYSGDTDRVPDASRITPQVVPPDVRSGHDIGVTVEIDAGVPVSDVRSPSHQLRIERDRQIVRIKLGGEDTIPNKDLILRYRVASDNTQATVLTETGDRGGHFAIYLIPALEYRPHEIVAKDVVFLMDTSASQMGEPLAKSQELMRRFINRLNPDDTFTIIDFANTTRQLSAAPLPNTPENRATAIHYINKLQADGGTYLLEGIHAVLNFPAAPAGRVRTIVLLTDGYIGNDNEVLAEVQRHLQLGNRIHSFGVGSSVNRFLLNRLAEVGLGTCQVVRQDEPTQEVAEKFFRQINNPVLTNIGISWEGDGEASVIYPTKAPDLFAEQPLVLFGRKQDRAGGKLHVTGIAAGGTRYEKSFNLSFEDSGNPAIAQLWGRARIKDLMTQMFGGEKKSLVEAVTDTALSYQLLSEYTAFVAVSEEVRVDPEGDRVTVQVPVEMPQGVSYEGIFGSPGGNFNSTAHMQRDRGGGGLGFSFQAQDEAEIFESFFAGSASPSVTRSPAPAAPPAPTPQFYEATDEDSDIDLSEATSDPNSPNIVTTINQILDKALTDGMSEIHIEPLEEFVLIQMGKNGVFEEFQRLPKTVGNSLIYLLKIRADWDITDPQKPPEVSIQRVFSGRLVEFRVITSPSPYGEKLVVRVLDNSHSQLQIISVTGLDEAATSSLTQYLHNVKIPAGFSGEIVFEFPVENGRVGRIVLDDQASTLDAPEVVDPLKRSLVTWLPPQDAIGTVRLTLGINP